MESKAVLWPDEHGCRPELQQHLQEGMSVQDGGTCHLGCAVITRVCFLVTCTFCFLRQGLTVQPG